MALIKCCFSFIIICFYLLFSITCVFSEQNQKRKNISQKSTAKTNIAKKTAGKKGQVARKKSENTVSYKIRKGDTIRKIAKVRGVSEKDILSLNKNINPKMLKPGQVILIPNVNMAKENNGYKNTASRSSKKYSLAKEEIKNFEKIKENSAVTSSIQEDDFDGDEDINSENFADFDSKKQEYLYSLRDDDLKKLINSALDYVGATYKYGGDSIASLDCSAFVRRVFREVNINLPRTSREQYTLGSDVSLEELREGDLIFFAKRNRINHVGIYIGDNMYIHAARKGKGVIVSSLDSPYVKRYFVGAKRLFTLQSASYDNLSKEKLIN
ncbi:MAG: NlpC/P60 family protein [Proteobacteria bacterium]|nr:NlpC/P60 family protein [Pseudomonadota bacterium]